MEDSFLIANRIQTPDGTILWSRFDHDYVEYIDKNGETYMLDGGPDTLSWRTSVNKIPAKPLQVYSNIPFEEIRKYILRQTFTKNGYYVWIPLYKINNNHLVNILSYNKSLGIKSKYDQFIEMEIEYRKKHNINIEEGPYRLEDGVQNIIKT